MEVEYLAGQRSLAWERLPYMHLPKYWIDRRVYEYFAVNLGVRLSGEVPVLIYQMGKVGSSSIRNTLFRHPGKQTRWVLMSHEFYPVRRRIPERLKVEESDQHAILEEIAHSKRSFEKLSLRRRLALLCREKLYSEAIHRNIIRRGKPARVITVVREPVSNNISMFFQVLDEYLEPKLGIDRYSTEQLMRIFLEKYITSRPLTWLDAELHTMLGIDVYAHPFPVDEGRLTLRQGPLELLILKCELSDSKKAAAIAEFLGLKHLSLVRSNVSADKDYAERYAAFKRSARFPEAYLETVYESKYARHFYGKEERRKLRARWRGAGDT